MFRARKQPPEVWKGVAAGVTGGLVASWTMNQFQAALSKASQVLRNGEQGQRQAEGNQESEDATMKAADKLWAGVLHRPLSQEQKKKVGPVVHYSFGALMGGVYGAAAEVAPAVKSGAGLPFGTVLFLGADEMAVPALGLSGPPTEYPMSTHASALAAHLVYGLTAEAVRRLARKALQLPGKR